MSHIKYLRYKADGIILFNDLSNRDLTKDITNDLNITLGLNGTFYMNNNNSKHDTRTDLVYRRKRAYKRAMEHIQEMKSNHKFTKQELEKTISNEEKNQESFQEYIYLFTVENLITALTIKKNRQYLKTKGANKALRSFYCKRKGNCI